MRLVHASARKLNLDAGVIREIAGK